MAVPDQPLFGLLRARERSTRLWSQSAVLALLVYGAALAAALGLSGQPALRTEPRAEQLVVTLLDLPSPAPEPLAAAGSEGAGSAVAEEPVARPAKARARVAPRVEPELVKPSKPAALAAEPIKVEPVPAEPIKVEPAKVESAVKTADGKLAGMGSAGGGGVGNGSGVGAGTGGGLNSGTGTGTGTFTGSSASTATLPFRDGMSRPVLLSKVDPTYTREALAAGVEGLILSKCVITTRGELTQCRIVKGLQYMDGAVLKALAQWRYSPVIYQGKATAVEYVIPVRLVRP